MARGQRTTQMRRPRPTRELVLGLTGGNAYVLECWHNNQHDMPGMRAAYPHLDLLEFAAVQVGAWEIRRRGPVPSPSSDPYALFSDMCRRGFPLINKYKDVAGDALYRALNPHERKRLEERITRLTPDEFGEIADEFARPANEWLAEYRYRMRVREAGSNDRLRCAHWLPYGAGRKNGQLVPALAGDISRTVRGYPTVYVPLHPRGS